MTEKDGDDDPRLRSAWRTWLAALAVDAEAAVAASLAYESLSCEGRDAWLDAVAHDQASLAVPGVALYAPLLAVEEDARRRGQILMALERAGQSLVPRPVRALCGTAPSGEHVCALVSTLYLDFVALLVCRYRPEAGFLSVRRDPVRNVLDVLGRRPSDGADDALACTIDGVAVREAPLGDVIEDLAHAIVADRRQGRSPPAALAGYAHLFVPDIAPSSARVGAA